MQSRDEIQLEVKRFDSLKTWRRNWESDWEQIALMMMPWRADFITSRSPGDGSRYRNQYDGTAPNAIDVLSGHMHTNLTSPSMRWFEMEYRDDELNDNDAAKEWLEDCGERMMGAINDSNFVVSIGETYEDLIAFGTGCLETGQRTENGFELVFRLHPLNTVVIAEDHNRRVDTVYIETQYTARQAKSKWPEASIPKVEQALKQAPDRKITFLRAVKPNPKYKPGIKIVRPDQRPIVATWICKGDLLEIEEQFYYELPYQVPRWKTSSAEIWGHGLGIKAIPDVMTLNESKRLALRSWEKAIDPPLMGEADGIIGDLHLEAGGYTKCRDTNAIKPLTDQANWQAHQLQVQDMRSAIQSIFFIDQLIVPERPNQTATEVTIRYEMMQKMLGSTMGRLQSELLDPLIQRVFNMMFRARQFDEPPQEVKTQSAAGVDVIDVKYVGPLARSQSSDEAVAVERLVSALGGMAEVAPEMLDILDPTGAARVLADRYGTPAKATRGDKEIEKIRGDRQKQQQQREAAQQTMMAAEASNATTDATMNRQALQEVATGGR